VEEGRGEEGQGEVEGQGKSSAQVHRRYTPGTPRSRTSWGCITHALAFHQDQQFDQSADRCSLLMAEEALPCHRAEGEDSKMEEQTSDGGDEVAGILHRSFLLPMMMMVMMTMMVVQNTHHKVVSVVDQTTHQYYYYYYCCYCYCYYC